MWKYDQWCIDMADDADRAGPSIEAVVAAGRARAKHALDNPRLRPIVQVIEGTRHRVGICHYCESEITPGHLFCPTDPVEPEQSCAVVWEHERQRKEANGNA